MRIYYSDFSSLATGSARPPITEENINEIIGGGELSEVPVNLEVTTEIITDPATSSSVLKIIATWEPPELEEDEVSKIQYYEWEITEESVNTLLGYSSGIRAEWLGRTGYSYSVRVRSVSKLGVTSEWTDSVSVTAAGDSVPPGVATGLSASTSLGSIFLTWTAPSDTDLKNFEVYENTSNNSATATLIDTITAEPSKQRTYTRTGVPNNATRYYWIKSVDTSGNKSAFSAVVSVTTPVAPSAVDTTPPATPGTISLTSSAYTSASGTALSKIIGTWTNVADADLAGYEIEITEASVITMISTVGSNRFEINPARVGIAYSFRVRAFDKTGNKSGWSASASITAAGDTVAPAVPTGLAVSTSLSAFYIEATAPADIDLYAVLIYENTTNTSGTATQIGVISARPGQKISISRSGLATGTTRFYWARAIDISGNISAFSSSATATIPSINVTDFASGITVPTLGATLPTTGNYDGRLFYLTTDKKLYRYNGTAWVAHVNSTDINGQLADSQIAAIAASKITGQLTNSQLEDIAAAKIVGQLLGSQISDGAIGTAKFASGLTVPLLVSTLPTTGNYDGRLAYLTTDKKLYRHNGTSWIATNAASDLTGQITNTQIADIAAAKLTGQITSTQISDSAISTPKLAAGAVSTAKLAAGAVTANEIAANTITAGQIAADTITAGQIAAGAIGASEIAAGAVIAGKIAAGTIVADDIASNAITAVKIIAGAIETAKIATGAITTIKIAANAVTANEIAANTITAGQIAADTITAGQIAASAIGVSELAANAVTAAKIGAGEVIAEKIASNAITTDKLIAGAVTALKIATGAVETDKLAANSVSAIKIQAGAITTDKLVAGARPVGVWGLFFEGNAGGVTNRVSWGSFWINVDTSTGTTPYSVSGGTANFTGSIITLYWTIGSSSVSTSTVDIGGDNVIVLARYGGGPSVDSISYGKTIISGGEIKTNSITADHLTANSVTAVKIAADSIASNKIQAGAIISSHITVGTLNGDRIQAGTIEGSKLVVNTSLPPTITIGSTGVTIADTAANPATRINSGTTQIQPGKILIEGGVTLDGWRTGTEINGNAIKTASIEANRLTVTQLSAITSNLGTVTAGTINVGTGGIVIRSATSGQRLELGSAALRVYDTAGTLRVRLGIY